MPASIDPARASFFQRNGLTLVFLALMAASLMGHAVSGWRTDSAERRDHGRPPQAVTAYLGSGEFLSSLFENWESEFLQMGLFVLLTAHLRQRGAAESRPLDLDEEDTPTHTPHARRPWPARRGGPWRTLYAHSLSGALLLLFAVSFGLHGYNSWRHEAEEQMLHGGMAPSLAAHLASPQLWFESFQNWQSEFLAVVALVLLSIVLREKDSTESKNVDDPHGKTGTGS